MEVKGPWVAEGNVEEVCTGDLWFVVLWRKTYRQHGTSRIQDMMITWQSHQQNQELEMKLAAKARTC